MATIASIPLEKIERIRLYINNTRQTLAAIKAETGADYVLNGTLFDTSSWQPVMHFRADGVTYCSDPYNYNGLAWNVADLCSMKSADKEHALNYICGVNLVADKKAMPLYYDKALGGARGRSVIGVKGDNLVLYCVSDGDAGKCTPEELRSEMLALGMDYALMLDGGSSSQCDFDGKRVFGSRVVQNLILVYTKKEKPMPDYDYLVCLDPGHGGKDYRNQSPDGTYKEHVFSLDLANRIKHLLEAQGIRVVMTRDTDTFVDLKPRAAIANGANATLFLSIHSNASAGGGWSSPSGLVCYTYAPGGKRNDLANAILNRMRGAGVSIFGSALYHAGFAVLKYTSMPACLVEYGFHTSKTDVALLKDNAYKDKLALATAKAICDYLKVEYRDKQTRYRVQVAEFSSRAAAQAVVAKIAEVGINAEIEEVI